MDEYLRSAISSARIEIERSRDSQNKNSKELRALKEQVELANIIELVKMNMLGENAIYSNAEYVRLDSMHPALNQNCTSQSSNYQTVRQTKIKIYGKSSYTPQN